MHRSPTERNLFAWVVGKSYQPFTYTANFQKEIDGILPELENCLNSSDPKEVLGKLCFAYLNGQWARVKILSIASSSFIECMCIDSGLTTIIATETIRTPKSIAGQALLQHPPLVCRIMIGDVTSPSTGWSRSAVYFLKVSQIYHL